MSILDPSPEELVLQAKRERILAQVERDKNLQTDLNTGEYPNYFDPVQGLPAPWRSMAEFSAGDPRGYLEWRKTGVATSKAFQNKQKQRSY
jgi:hypothetical protein